MTHGESIEKKLQNGSENKLSLYLLWKIQILACIRGSLRFYIHFVM